MKHEPLPSSSLPLSVIMVVRNGGALLAECLNSCRFAAEVVLVDDYSTDDTVSIARQFGARVFTRALDDDWATQQNFALQQARYPWVLLLDADELVSPELAASITQLLTSDPVADSATPDQPAHPTIYQLKIAVQFTKIKVRHGMFRDDWIPRLFPRQGVHWEGCVHSTLISDYPIAKLPDGVIYHRTIQNLPQYWFKMARYAQLAAEKYYRQHKSISFLRDVLLRPLWSWFQSYIVWGGLLDGRWGWYFALQYAHYTRNKYLQLYLLQYYNGQL